MNQINQEQFWNKKWEHISKRDVNLYAKECYEYIRKKQKEENKQLTLLELGCGEGSDTFFFAKNNIRVTAVDISENVIKNLQTNEGTKKMNVTFIRQDITNISFPECSFDIIYAHLSLHYFDDKTTCRIFEKLHNILKETGLLFVKCKSTKDMLFGKGEMIEKNMFNDEGHVRHFFDKEYMEEKLKLFKIIKIKETSSVYHWYLSHFIEGIAVKVP